MSLNENERDGCKVQGNDVGKGPNVVTGRPRSTAGQVPGKKIYISLWFHP